MKKQPKFKEPKFQEIDKLLRKSKEDEAVLTMSINDQKISDSIFGFHAQQAVEKMFKAILTFYGIEFPKTHDLSTLSEYFQSNKIDFPFSLDELEILTPYAVTLRYDDEIEVDFDRHFVYQMVKNIRNWTEGIIKNKKS